MTKVEKVLKGLDLCKYDPDPGQEDKYHHSCVKCPYHDPTIPMCLELYLDAMELIKNLQECFQTAKNVAERYVQLCGESGVEDVRTWFSVIKNRRLLYKYQNKRATWTDSSDIAWLTLDRKMAEGFAKLTKGKVAEVTIAVRPLKGESV